MEREENACKAHVVVLPFPGQGHINPMLQFSKRLASKGLKVTLATTLYSTKFIQAQPSSVAIEPFSDGCDEEGIGQAGGIDAYLERLETVGSRNFAQLIEKHNSPEYPVRCLIYNSVMPWALDIAKRFGLIGAAFYTQSCSVNAIYYHVHQGSPSIPVQVPSLSFTGLPLLETHELPSFICGKGPDNYPSLLHLVMSQFSNFDKADWILLNSFDKLEDEVSNWMAKQWTMKTITMGPTVPSMYLDKRLDGDIDYGLNLFKPDSHACIEWLNTKETGSVVYVSFGSLASLGEEQIEELAWGLKRSENFFLWVVRASEEHKLPRKFVDETLEKGLVVRWCPQLEVLAHQATGCFLTHCGWNSILEALSLGVPMVAMPQWTDQPTNAKFVEDVWKVGVRVRVDEKGIVRREEVEVCIKEVMQGERRKEIKRNAERWKELAKEAVDEGGSSDKNIEEFVAHIKLA